MAEIGNKVRDKFDIYADDKYRSDEWKAKKAYDESPEGIAHMEDIRKNGVVNDGPINQKTIKDKMAQGWGDKRCWSFARQKNMGQGPALDNFIERMRTEYKKEKMSFEHVFQESLREEKEADIVIIKTWDSEGRYPHYIIHYDGLEYDPETIEDQKYNDQYFTKKGELNTKVRPAFGNEDRYRNDPDYEYHDEKTTIYGLKGLFEDLGYTTVIKEK